MSFASQFQYGTLHWKSQKHQTMKCTDVSFFIYCSGWTNTAVENPSNQAYIIFSGSSALGFWLAHTCFGKLMGHTGIAQVRAPKLGSNYSTICSASARFALNDCTFSSRITASIVLLKYDNFGDLALLVTLHRCSASMTYLRITTSSA